MTTLPDWSPRTVAVLSTVDPEPHAIPVSAPVRADDRTILLCLRRDRDSLARLRARPAVALTVLAGGDVAFTARGRAVVDEEPMAVDAGYTAVRIEVTAVDEAYAAVRIEVTAVDDHRQAAFHVTAGVDRDWRDAGEQQALGGRVRTLRSRARTAAATA